MNVRGVRDRVGLMLTRGGASSVATVCVVLQRLQLQSVSIRWNEYVWVLMIKNLSTCG